LNQVARHARMHSFFNSIMAENADVLNNPAETAITQTRKLSDAELARIEDVSAGFRDRLQRFISQCDPARAEFVFLVAKLLAEDGILESIAGLIRPKVQHAFHLATTNILKAALNETKIQEEFDEMCDSIRIKGKKREGMIAILKYMKENGLGKKHLRKDILENVRKLLGNEMNSSTLETCFTELPHYVDDNFKFVKTKTDGPGNVRAYALLYMGNLNVTA